MKEKKHRVTKEEFIERSKGVHGDKFDYSKVNYISTRQKVDIICKNCGNVFQQLPKNHMNGQGCPNCSFSGEPREKRSKHFTDFIMKEYGNEFTFPNPKEEYIDKKSRITTICNRCGSEYHVMAEYLVAHHFKCTKCDYLYSYEELKEKTGLDIVPFEGLRKDKVEVICKKHGPHVALISSILKGKGSCRKCALETAVKNKRLTPEEFSKRLQEKFNNVVVPYLDEYVDTSTPMTFKCTTCGAEFKRKPNTFLCGHLDGACPNCTKQKQSERRTKTIEEFIEEAKMLYGEDAFDFSKTTYTKSDEKVRIKCNSCGKYFEKEANSFLQGFGCPYHHLSRSILEEEIFEYVSSIYDGEILSNDRKILSGLELDIYIPTLKLGIEFDGLFWHCEDVKGKDYHIKKTEMCEHAGIRLIHIFEDEWRYKKDIWKSILKNIIIGDNQKVHARKCEIREVSSKDASAFLEENHIQGKCGSSVRYGLYKNDKLVSLMTFGKSRHFVGNGKHQYELLRFCSLKGVTVVGGASKLFTHFIKEHDPQDVISFADRRWSVGNLYDKLGFRLYNRSKPNYYYITGTKRTNRFNYRKSVLVERYGCPKDMSEREFCKTLGLKRIYDCGCLCYVWEKQKTI